MLVNTPPYSRQNIDCEDGMYVSHGGEQEFVTKIVILLYSYLRLQMF
jgi:hypothetical protein